MRTRLQRVAQYPFVLSIALSVIIFLLLLFLSPALQSTNIGFQYWWNRIQTTLPTVNEVNKRIIVVEIDNATFNRFGFPMDRSVYAPVIDHLTDAWVAAIGIDILFEDPSTQWSDMRFADAIADSQKVLLGFSSFDSLPWPILPLLWDHIVSTGFFDVSLDAITGVHRVMPQKILRDTHTYDYFPIAVLKSSDGYSDYVTKIHPDSIQISPLYHIPKSGKWDDILLRFLPRHMFSRVSFQSLYDPDQFRTIARRVSFEDAIVLIGVTADGTKDIFMTPNGQDYGVYIHANTINTILQWYFSEYFSVIIEMILLFICLLLWLYSNFTQRGGFLIASNIAICTVFLLIFPFVTALFTRLIPNFYIQFIVWVFFVLIFSNIFKYLFENRDKKILGKALWEYVSKEVSDEILHGSWDLKLDGEQKNIAIFFSDIQWFTTLSEKFSPEKLVYFLREYLGDMSRIIMDHRGFINKYEWDAIMALWGAFGKNDDMVYYACVSALDQQRALQGLQKKWKQSWAFEPFQVRMWIHVWDAILWNIGASGRKLEFTALWDSVNLASRLEWINKYYHSYICVSEDVYHSVQDSFDFRYLDNIRVKGKQKPIKIYELLSLKGKTSPEKMACIDQFRHAITLYYRQDFQRAHHIFSELAQHGDGPSQTYLERTQYFMEYPPWNNWDQIWTFSTK